MRVLPAAVVISATLHVAAYAWVRTHDERKLVAASLPAPRPAPAPAEAHEDPITEVVLLDRTAPPFGGAAGRAQVPAGDDHASVASVARSGTEMSQPGRRAPDVGRTARAELEVRAPRPETPTPPARSPWMTMRQPEITHGLSGAFVEQFLVRSNPLAAKDTEHERNEDALATDRDRLDNPKWMANASADDVMQARLAREAHREALAGEELHPDGGGRYKSTHETFGARVARDGTVQLRDTPDVDIRAGCLFGGCRMGIDDWLMRRAGEDPYRTAKLRWLDKTRDERAQIGLANRKIDLARSAQIMQQNLAWLWNRTRDASERKIALFEMWDEIAETGDDDLVHGGEAARRYLVGFVRSKLPAGSHGAFTADELAQLNAHRRSRAVFAPYP